MSDQTSADILIFPARRQRRGGTDASRFCDDDPVWYHLEPGARLKTAHWAAGHVTGYDWRNRKYRIELAHSRMVLWTDASRLRRRQAGELQPGRQGFGL